MDIMKYGLALLGSCLLLASCDKGNKDPDLATTLQGDYQVYAYKLDQDSVSLPTPPTSTIMAGTTSYSVASTLNFAKISNLQSTMNLQFQAVKKSVVNNVNFTTTTSRNINSTVQLSSGSGSNVLISDVSGTQLGTGTSQAVALTVTTNDNRQLRIYAKK